MSGTKILNLTGLVLIAAAVVACHSVPRLRIPRPEALPIRTFPRTIGIWQAGADRAVNPDIAQRLETATIVERDYSAPRLRDIDLLLITADRDQDIHDPGLCLPAQGWQMGKNQIVRIGNQEVSSVEVQQDEDRYIVFYWLSGYQPPTRASNVAMASLLKLRARAVGNREGASLLVRLVAQDTDRGRADITQFATQIMPQIEALRRAGKPA